MTIAAMFHKQTVLHQLIATFTFVCFITLQPSISKSKTTPPPSSQIGMRMRRQQFGKQISPQLFPPKQKLSVHGSYMLAFLVFLLPPYDLPESSLSSFSRVWYSFSIFCVILSLYIQTPKSMKILCSWLTWACTDKPAAKLFGDDLNNQHLC